MSPEPEVPDCLTCGACCRTDIDGLIAVYPQDLVRFRDRGRPELSEAVVPGRFGGLAFATTSDGACVHLGTADSACACAIYEERGETCRGFPAGCPRCHQFRYDAGVVG
ncbi:MAG: YkgJ family cysteine cluster protein [Myxococcales bacterium]|nr:YkgJ family cysteine cluster protein [Myxococcales bacterium]